MKQIPPIDDEVIRLHITFCYPFIHGLEIKN